jgi:alcohol dehydrogenase
MVSALSNDSNGGMDLFNFNYHMPTKIIMGPDCVKKNSRVLRKFGDFCLIVTGHGSSKINGSLEDAISALEHEDIKYRIFDEVEENPSLETVEKAFMENSVYPVDFIIAIGGGSAMDAAKAVSLLFRNRITARELLSMKNLKGIPILSIPTTAGTGSETTPYSVLTDHQESTKKNIGQVIFSDIAFLDARYTINLPHHITVSTAIDAFTHLAEGYLNRNSSIMSDILAEKGFILFGECIGALRNGCITIRDREKLMLASTLAGMEISQTGTSLPHGMGYPLTYFKGVPHGTANGILYEGYLSIFKDRRKIDRMLELAGISGIAELGDTFRELLKCDLVLSEGEITEYTESMLCNDQKLKNHPEHVTRDDIAGIYRSINRK